VKLSKGNGEQRLTLKHFDGPNFKVEKLWGKKIAFFLLLEAYIRMSEVTSKCKTPQKQNPDHFL